MYTTLPHTYEHIQITHESDDNNNKETINASFVSENG